MNNDTIVKSQILTLKHGFSTRCGGVSKGIFKSLNLGLNRGDDKFNVIENWNRFLSECDISGDAIVCANQVHGNYVHVATRKDMKPPFDRGETIEADGFVSCEKGVTLAVFTADCVPVLIEDAKNGVIGALHCGWRSTVADIQKAALTKMLVMGADLGKIKASIGPAIGKCCFEVGDEVIEGAEKLIGDLVKKHYTKLGEKYMLDLRGVVKERFIMLGLKSDNIEIIEDCTMCNPDRYWSHRYTKGERGSQASVITLS